MKYIVIFLLGILVSCQKEVASPQNTTLVGAWEQFSYQPVSAEFPGGGTLFKRSRKLPENKFGYQFEASGKLKSRENAGWCGTPPISYATYEGKWALSDDKLSINKKFWGGDQVVSLKITFLNKNQMVIETLQP